MPYQIAGIDVHKKMLAVVVADVEVEGDYHFERLKVGTSPAQLRALADWLVEREVEEVVWNRPRSTGDPCGRHWSSPGGRCAGRAQERAPCPGPFTLRRPNPIVAPAGANGTFRMPNDW